MAHNRSSLSDREDATAERQSGDDSNIDAQYLPRRSGPFATAHAARKYWVILTIVVLFGLLAGYGLLAYKNPIPVDDPRFWLIAERRFNHVTAMLVVAFCQSLATVTFQTVTNNRIITPSIMGFESLYRIINTSIVFFFGSTALVSNNGMGLFLFQLIVMIGLSLLLYGWLLTGKRADMHAMLLVGIVIGGGLGSLTTFMQRLLAPSEFDVLQARLFGSVNNADPTFYPIGIPVALIAGILVLVLAKRLNILALGPDAAINLGVNHRAHTIFALVLVSILMAVSTAMVGPMTFLGFLVATLAYQFCDTYDHRFILPMSFFTAFAVLAASYFLMNHVFNAQGVVSIIIELVGGGLFLIVILRKGKL